jgi:hypothetical protein
MKARLFQEAAPKVQGNLWTWTYILVGRRSPTEVAELRLKRVRGMREPSTSRVILPEEARQVLFL